MPDEIPEHLLKRAQERRAALEAKKAAEASGAAGAAGAGAGATPEERTPSEGGTPPQPETSDVTAPAAASEDESKIPAALLARSQAARAKAEGGREAGASGGAATATATMERAERAGAKAAAGGAPLVAGAGAHTQRLLTVVKAGSIQDVKAAPTDKVHTWPHLLVIEFAAALAMSAFLLVFSTFVNAPLQATANINLTPNPSKAPWYFLGLQELLTMFHPMVAGVMIPGIGLAVLALAGFIDKNPSHRPEDRKFATGLFTFFLMFWAVLVIVGSFFEGEGFNFILPWRQGVHGIFDL